MPSCGSQPFPNPGFHYRGSGTGLKRMGNEQDWAFSSSFNEGSTFLHWRKKTQETLNHRRIRNNCNMNSAASKWQHRLSKTNRHLREMKLPDFPAWTLDKDHGGRVIWLKDIKPRTTCCVPRCLHLYIHLTVTSWRTQFSGYPCFLMRTYWVITHRAFIYSVQRVQLLCCNTL